MMEPVSVPVSVSVPGWGGGRSVAPFLGHGIGDGDGYGFVAKSAKKGVAI
jgi:hypothetical protein